MGKNHCGFPSKLDFIPLLFWIPFPHGGKRPVNRRFKQWLESSDYIKNFEHIRDSGVFKPQVWERKSVKAKSNLKSLSLILIVSFFLNPFNLIASVDSPNSKPMPVKAFSLQLMKELGLSYKLMKDPVFHEILTHLPESTAKKLKRYNPDAFVSRKLLIDVLSPYLDPQDTENIVNSGNLKKAVTVSEIMDTFAKCKYENNVLTYIKPESHKFNNILDRHLRDVTAPSGTSARSQSVSDPDPEQTISGE